MSAAEKRIALTFDDGPDPEITPQVLDILAEFGVTATFFLIGENITAETAPIVRRTFDMGCELCNHSLTHTDLSGKSPAEITHELAETTRRIEALTGTQPHFFRPPYIAVSDTLFDAVELPFVAGYGVNDFDAAVSVAERVTGVLQKAKPDGIILMHDQEENVQTVAALREIIPGLLRAGYRFVTMSQLFAETGITPLPRVLYSYAQQTTMYAEDI